MNDYEKLLIEVEPKGIQVYEEDLYTSKECGYCIGDTIIINSNMNNTQKKCVLAEEIGHYKLTVGDISKLKTVNDKKQELKARRWGYKHIVSLERIIEAIECNCINRYEIAEYIGITDKYFEECINDYKKQYGVSIAYGKYVFMFEPTFSLYINFEWS